MPSRRQFIGVAAGVALAGCTNRGATDTTTDGGSGPTPTTAETAAASPTPGDAGDALALSTPAFDDGGPIPAKYTADGADVSPPLSIESVPDGAETLALVVDDPDAPGGPFVHWLLWNVPVSVTSVPEGIPQQETVPALDGARQGTNGFGELGYRGPKPPRSDGPHTYRFTLHTVDATLSVSAGAKRQPLADALGDHSVATARITGEYDRN